MTILLVIALSFFLPLYFWFFFSGKWNMTNLLLAQQTAALEKIAKLLEEKPKEGEK